MKKYLYHFCYSTSIKGVSRILKAEVIGLRILWFVAVFCFLGIGAYQVYLLVTQYFHRPTLTNIKEEYISMSDVEQTLLPPQVTVCNLNPFSSFARPIQGVVPFDRYKQLACLYSQCTKYLLFSPDGSVIGFNLTASLVDRNMPTTPSITSYFQFIGKDAAGSIGHAKETFIVECRILILYGLRFVKEECGSSVDIQTLLTVEYLNCFELRISSHYQGKAIRGIELILFLDNNGMELSGMGDTAIDRAAGAKLFIHEAGTKPLININGIYMMAGEWYKIHVKQEQRTRLRPPWGECYKMVNGTVYEYTFDKRRYTFHGCVSVCIEYHITKDCGCKDVNLMSLFLEDETEEFKRMNYCQDIKIQGLNGSAYFDQFYCTELYRGLRTENCTKWCQLPCKEMRYRTTTSQSKWPNRQSHDAFYTEYIKNRIYENRFTSKVDWKRTPKLVEKLINENFLRASVYMGDSMYNQFVDKAAITPFSLLSQLGGALNLWSGITVIIVIEVIDLVVHIIQDKLYPDKTTVIKVKTMDNQL